MWLSYSTPNKDQRLPTRSKCRVASHCCCGQCLVSLWIYIQYIYIHTLASICAHVDRHIHVCFIISLTNRFASLRIRNICLPLSLSLCLSALVLSTLTRFLGAHSGTCCCCCCYFHFWSNTFAIVRVVQAWFHYNLLALFCMLLIKIAHTPRCVCLVVATKV